VFFVAGQALLRGSKLDPLSTAHVFIVSMGIVAAIAWMLSRHVMPKSVTSLFPAIAAGAAFYIGNVIWVRAIKTSPNIAFVRVLMAGVETALLLGVALLFFNQKASLMQILLTFAGLVLLAAAAFLAS
jgi:uncharacterized membrane protein